MTYDTHVYIAWLMVYYAQMGQQKQTYIKMALNGTWNCALYEHFLFIFMLKLYALFINGENETALYRQWFVI